MKRVRQSWLFSIFATRFVIITKIAKVGVGLVRYPWLVANRIIVLLNGKRCCPRVPWLCDEEQEEVGMSKKASGQSGFYWQLCWELGSSLVWGPSSYWAAFEETFLRVKLDQFTATFWRVCLAESRQNLQQKEKETDKKETFRWPQSISPSENLLTAWLPCGLCSAQVPHSVPTFWSIPPHDQSHPFL